MGRMGSFTVSGMPVPDVTQWGLIGNDDAVAEAVPADTSADAAADVEIPGKDVEKSVRHNACFLHPQGIPGSEAKGWMPDRPWMSGCRYHDMVKETIYMKGSKDLDNLRRVMDDLRHKREAERAEFSKSRFNRQRETAALWADMQDTFRVMNGKPEAPTLESMAETLRVEPIASAAPPASSSSAASYRPSVATSSGAASPPSGASYMPRRAASMPGLHKVPCLRSGKLVREGGRGAGRVSVGLAGPNDYVPFKQEPGNRGLPPDFCPAKPSTMGVAIWDRNRSHTIEGRRMRGWD